MPGTSEVLDSSEVRTLRRSLARVLREGKVHIRPGDPVADHESLKFGELKEDLRRSDPVKKRTALEVDDSLGKGRFASVPWVRIFDRREAASPRRGVYCAFLFRQDMSGVYLTLMQGVTGSRDGGGHKGGMSNLQDNARLLGEKYGALLEGRFALSQGMDLRAKSRNGAKVSKARDYEDATIAHKLYSADDLPPDADVCADLDVLLAVYEDYVRTKVQPVETRRSESPRPLYRNPDPAASTTSFSQGLAASHIHFGSRHEELVRSFIAGLATKRFVILTGLSGSGKTQIALRFGDWLDKDRRLVVPVRPDWTGPDALFGYEDALQPPVGDRKPWYVPDVLKFMLKACGDAEHPYLLVLDEMNLAHVERYFADFLSGIESDEPCLPDLAQDDEGRWLIRDLDNPKLRLPSNLFVVGTVNVDETTYMFSPKVLDRANTYEFRVATEDLQDDLHKPTKTAGGPDELVRGFLEVAKDEAWQDTHPAPERQQFSDRLRQLHRLLAEGDFEFGHRVFYEANRYAAMLASAGNASLEDALDQQVYQKVLPRLHGSRRRLEPTLRALGRFCWDFTVDTTNAPGNAFDPEAPVAGQPKLPLSFQKVRRMFRSLQANQFTSFTE